MKNFLLIISMMPFIVSARQMEGFGANYYHDDLSIPNYYTYKKLVPNIRIGNHTFVMEFSNLSKIAKVTGIAVNQDNHASWLCLTSKNINYWFISDNEMGKSDLTSIAITNAGQQKSCPRYSGNLDISIKGIPLQDASFASISSIFSHKPDGNIIQYCNDTKSYGDFTQINCLQYYMIKNSVSGVLISQITSN